MTHVPSQWSWMAISADLRVIGAIALLCAIGLGLLYAVCCGASTAAQTLAAVVVQTVRSVRRQ